MNEKIKELMLEAGYAAPEMAGRATKLSELIIKECYQVCKDNLCILTETDSDEAFKYNEGVADCAIVIKQRFGVEE